MVVHEERCEVVVQCLWVMNDSCKRPLAVSSIKDLHGLREVMLTLRLQELPFEMLSNTLTHSKSSLLCC